MSQLALLDDVAWRGAPVRGARAHALLAALVAAGGRAVGEARLVEEVWGEDRPASAAKALQVVVSRVRAQTDPGAVRRSEQGYALGVAPDEVDALALGALVDRACRAEASGDTVAARDLATAALAVAVAGPGEPGPLEELRARARERLGVARAVLGRVCSARGEHPEALRHLSAVPHPDEATLAALLRSELAVHGAPAALLHYEAHRRALAEELGVDPGPVLQAVHGELLAADNPVRSGLHYDSTSLVGRDDDLRALRAAMRDSRVTSILGPGGLGKTRLAHLLGREAEQQVVHFVELVGVSSPEDVVVEVGSALGVRDSVSGRRVLSAERLHDVRSRIAAQLDQAPTLLILDNCEHVIAAVTDLVAHLVAVCGRLRVLTTTRAPLGIAAERVFALAQLDEAAAGELFVERATGARPGVALDEGAVRRVVARLDGLPLTIELAAAKVRVMSVEEVARRLDDRFRLLRGADRSKPDRHQTLLSVIDWSWNLLDEAEREALARLSVFHDGFTLDTAEAVLPGDALSAVQSLVDQSLLAVGESGATVRYRMLETVREFGRQRLAASGREEDALTAQLAWARDFTEGVIDDLYSVRQFEVMDELTREEGNLADVLRLALARAERTTALRVFAGLANYWNIKGEHPRVFALGAAMEDLVAGWTPSAEEVDDALDAAAILTINTVIAQAETPAACRALLEDYGDLARRPATTALVTVLRAFDPHEPEPSPQALAELLESSDRGVAMSAREWGMRAREAAGDLLGAVAMADRALELWREEDGPWSRALVRTQLAGLHAQLGNTEEAATHALAAIPVLDRLEAWDDAISTRAILAGAAIEAGRLDEAQQLVDRVIELNSRNTAGFGSGVVITACRAELALRREDTAEGLALFRLGMEQLRDLWFPGLGKTTGLESWTLFGEAAATTAYALHARGDEGRDLYDTLRIKAALVLDPARQPLEYPTAGMVLYALGAWGLVREEVPLRDAARLLALARRFSYSRFTPILAWERTAELVERTAPGELERLHAEYADRTGPDLLDEARALVATL
ncbi:AAA family ATPase [Nocardioides sp. cx-173]|uniref:ATP-binding protein n=1 Tax=Nocardioides sp. cx-173 TaxID=2898796 RepID=UPI001E3C0E4F|nr:AAA family ATPase [Nocardioides sp. cx-173]MCD4526130.1 AAA family ATPase [Nocardioides sp. cx-173]UGB43819.1 AAA family ATPase [Nocardioides sp. cx-173]